MDLLYMYADTQSPIQEDKKGDARGWWSGEEGVDGILICIES